MPTLDWPIDLVPAKATWGLQSNTEAFTSPLNRSTQTVERPGARWKATLEFPPMGKGQRGRLEAFLASMNGMAGRVRLWPHAREGSAAYSPTVDGTMFDFRTLRAKGFPPNTLVLRAGDYLEVGGELKMVTGDVASDGGGLASWIPVAPPFRAAPADNAPIILYRPSAVMMLSADEFQVSVTPGNVSDVVVISAVEVF